MQPTTAFGSFLVAVLSASFAAGAALSPEPSSFEIKRVPNENFTGRNGPLALARAYAKWGVKISDNLRLAVEKSSQALKEKRQSGTAVATPDNDDLEYLVPVKIGTPAQTLNLDFDTGSSDLWVFSSETPKSSSSGHSLYTPSKSSTSKKLSGATWSIRYEDESTSSGDVYTDAVTIGGLTVSKQAVESAEQVSSQFATGNNDGLVGLAYSVGNTVKPTKQKTWFDNISSNLDSPLFVADLRHDAAGSYTFGAIPSAAKNILYTDADVSDAAWQFSTSSDLTGDFDAIADTGTTLLLGLDDLVDAYYEQVPSATYSSSQEGYVFDCSEDLPDFTFTVGSGEITVPGSLINYGAVNSRTCYGGIQSVSDLPFAIFGDVALKSSYVVFDKGNTRVGWAQK